MDSNTASINDNENVVSTIYNPEKEKIDNIHTKISGEVEPPILFDDAKAVSSWSPPKTRPPFFSSTSIQEKAQLLAGNITVEPMLFMFVVSFTLGMVTTQSLVIRKFCLLEMKLPDAVCRNLTHKANEVLERQAQELASTLGMYKTLLDTIPVVIMSLFLGPWSDKHGRKTLLVLPNVGACCSFALMGLYAYFELELEPRYMLLTGVPFSLCGGMTPLMIGSAAYISDTSTSQSRVIRFAVMTAFMMSGAPLGTVVGGVIFNQFGYVTVYGVALVLSFIGMLYVIFFLKETVKKPDGPSNPCKDFFDLSYVRQGFATCFRKRENNNRMHLLLLIVAMTINFFPIMGEMSVAYLYARRKFGWSEVMYSYYTATTLLATMFGLLIVLPILKMLVKMPDIAIALVGAACRICSESMIAFASEGWLLFTVAPLLVFAGMYSPILRGILSQIVSKEEQGKLYAVVGACEASVPVVGAVLYTKVYNATSATFPGAVFLMSGSFFIIPTIIFIWIRRDINRRTIANTEKSEKNTGETPM